MLKKMHVLLSHHLNAALQSFILLCRKPMATLMTVMVIAIALALPALFWVCTANLSQLAGEWRQGGRISLYLKLPLTEVEQKHVVQTVLATDGVGQASLKSPAEGLSELAQQEGMHDIMSYLPENPLPAVIDVLPALMIDSPEKLDALIKKLKTIPQIDVVKWDMEWIRRLNAILGFTQHASHILFALLALAVVFIIGNTLRLTIQSKQEEIQILKLIGATDPFILRPFVYSGIWYGITGAVLAIFIVNLFILSLGMALNDLIFMYQMHYPLTGMSLKQTLILTLFAVILGWIGARLSVKRQLSVIEPYN